MPSLLNSMIRWRRTLIAAVLAAGIGCAAIAWRIGAAELTKPSPEDRQVTLLVRAFLKREHLSKHALDDEISQRGLKAFLKTLDPLKVYFYQSDVDEFASRKTDLDDKIRQGDIRFGYTIFKRFLHRVDERVQTVQELLNGKFDFTKDEQIVIDGDMANYPRSPAEARDRWRRRLKYDLLVLESDKTTGKKAVDKLRRRYSSFASRMHQTDGHELLEMYLTSFTSSYDPHTTYMSPATLENFRILMRLNLEGIGAALRVDDGYIVVSEIIPNGAADKHGKLKPEDRIVSVGQGLEGEMEDVVDRKLTDVVKLIRGKAGTIVRLGVTGATGGETKIYKITRARIELKDSEARGVIRPAGKKANGKPFKVGVINLPSFYMDMEAAQRNERDYKSTTRDVRRILDDFGRQGVDVVLLDLRRNGGGSLTEAINLTGLFIDEGPVVQVKDSGGRIQHFDDEDEGMAWSGPLVVATSKFSASASEIFAGAIQDYRRGIVVGDAATHGKGTVQTLLDLGSQVFRINNPPNLGALKITMQQFYLPKGASTQKRGVLADIVLPSLSTHMDVGEADLDFAIEFDRIPALDVDNYGRVSERMLAPLRAKSAVRRGGSDKFRKLLKDIERYKEQKKKKKVSIKRDVFLAERKELNAEKEDEKTLENQGKSQDKVFADNFYNQELLSIAADYTEMLQTNRQSRNSRNRRR